jgi:CubicO group peptidase (beta-lactamase class C family)
MKAKILKTLLGIIALIVSISILFVVVKLASDVPTFKEGPAPRLGTEVGSIQPETAERLQRLFEDSGVPSMVAGIVVGDELVWAKGYGEQPDLSTVYVIGSIDKTFIAAALLQLREQGLIDLDDDINAYLPYSVRHPDAPDVPITIRMLLTHTSGLPHDVPGTGFVHSTDGPMVRWELVNQSNIDGLWDYLFPPSEEKVGRIFEIKAGEGPDFWLFRPGTGYQYSNTAFYMLLVPIIEAVSGQSYATYLQEHVIAPLGMENTSLEASDYPQAQLAIPWEEFPNGRNDLPLTSFGASGKIRTNVLDLAKYLLAHMNQGALGDRRILEPESVALMHERHRYLSLNDFPPKYTNGAGLSWFLHGGGYQGHSGFVAGLMAEILYNDREEVPYGMVFMMTKSHAKTELDWDWWHNYYVPIQEILLEEGKAMALAEGN